MSPGNFGEVPVAKKIERASNAPPTSRDVDSIATELRYAGDRAEIAKICLEIADHLRTLDLPDHYRSYIEIGRAPKKNFAQKLSHALAQKVGNALRVDFAGVNPDANGKYHESKSRSASGLKKLDVNYSTTQMGLGLAVSIKTINFKDEETQRYTKNIKRADGELRAEAQDCHTRQPYAVLVAVVMLPADAAHDGEAGVSSLKHAWKVFRHRGGRTAPEQDSSLFELVYIGTYESSGADLGKVRFTEVSTEMPDWGPPPATVSFSQVLAAATRAFKVRNRM